MIVYIITIIIIIIIPVTSQQGLHHLVQMVDGQIPCTMNQQPLFSSLKVEHMNMTALYGGQADQSQSTHTCHVSHKIPSCPIVPQ